MMMTKYFFFSCKLAIIFVSISFYGCAGGNYDILKQAEMGASIEVDTDSNGDVDVAFGGTNGSTAAAARTNLGLVIGTDVLAPDGDGSGLTGIVAELDDLSDVTGEGSANYILQDDGDGTYSFTNTPTLTGTNFTGIPISTGISGSVANLMTALSDEGAFADDLLGYADAAAVLAGIGAEGDLSNSAGLAAAISDETGTQYSVFSDSPAFTTQISIGGNAITAAIAAYLASIDQNLGTSDSPTHPAITLTTGGLIANGGYWRLSSTTSGYEWTLPIYDNDDTTWRDAFTFTNGNAATVTAGAGVAFDFSSAGSVTFGPLVVPTTTSGDQTLSTGGQVGFKTDEDFFIIHGGANGEVQDETGISLINTLIVRFYATTEYDNNDENVVDLLLMDDAFPHGITLTEWKIENINGDYATTQLDVDLICDSGGDWNDDAGTTVMDVLDTTSGSATADTGFDSASCPNGSSMYLRFGSDPVDDDEPTRLKLQFYRNED